MTGQPYLGMCEHKIQENQGLFQVAVDPPGTDPGPAAAAAPSGALPLALKSITKLPLQDQPDTISCLDNSLLRQRICLQRLRNRGRNEMSTHDLGMAMHTVPTNVKAGRLPIHSITAGCCCHAA